MIGTHNIDVLLKQKTKLYESSLKFANFDTPDFILMKEAVMAFDKIVVHQMTQA